MKKKKRTSYICYVTTSATSVTQDRKLELSQFVDSTLTGDQDQLTGDQDQLVLK